MAGRSITAQTAAAIVRPPCCEADLMRLLPALAGPLILSVIAGCTTPPAPASGPPAASDRASLERAVRDT
jgi:hypothetical protein